MTAIDRLNHMQLLEAESIHIFREVVSEFQNPVMLYSIGKDSSVMLRLAQKAFHPGPIPFPLMHVDTGYKFDEMLEFRDRYTAELGVKLIVWRNEDALAKGANPIRLGTQRCCGLLKTQALLDGLRAHGFDAAFGGARRDEEKSRAKERVFSFRDSAGQWDPKNQRPELWNIFNGRKHPGEHFRVFPISNWTELDVWQYILNENIKLPELYYTHRRKIFSRNGVYLAWAPFMQLKPNEEVFETDVRCRTIGDITCTGVTLSKAETLEEIIAEIAATRVTERGGRHDDKRSEAAMEDRKKEGYF